MPDDAAKDRRFQELWSTLALNETVDVDPGATLAASPEELRPAGDVLASLPVLLGGGARGAAGLPADLEPLGELGAGGMGVVHLARQRSLRREVAVKSLHSAERSEHGAESLVAEARITGSLEHPGIIPVYALGKDAGGDPVLVMKRVSGVSWRELLHDPEHPAWAEHPGDRLLFHVQVLMKVCDTLDFAHSRGVIHRDLKPANVMLGRYGEVYLLDWGVALRVDEPPVGARRVVGTPAYMAPEMFDLGAKVTPRADVYLLGATLHEVLTRRPRHEGKSLQSVVLSAYLSEPVQYGADVPSELASLANAATQRDPAKRPASAGDFRRALEAWVEHRGSSQLADAARLRLDELLAFDLGAAPLARVHGLYGECAFGFSEALRVWPANAEAARGLDAVEAWMTRHELARGDPDAAAVHLERMRAPNEALAAEIATLRLRRSVDRREVQELKNLARAMDPKRGVRDRRRVFVAGMLTFSAALLAMWPLMRRGLVHMSYGVLYGFVFVASGLILSYLRRNRATLDATVHGARMRVTIPVTMATHLFTITVSAIMGLPPAAVLPLVLLNMALNTASLVAQGDRSHWPITLCTAIGAVGVAVVVRLAPSHVHLALTALALSGAGLALVRARLSSEGAPRPPDREA